MAHELSLRADGSAEMAFVGATPWHGLGKQVTEGASIGVWAKEAGMDWDAMEAPVRFEVPGIAALQTVDSHKVIYRGDTRVQLGVVGNGYNIVQPRAVLEFFRDEVEGGGWHIHTAGVLRGGRKVWAMASRNRGAKLTAKDQVRENLLLATSLDGSMKTIAQPTGVCVVCANTMAMALGQKGGIQVSHRTIFDPYVVKSALGIAAERFDVFMKQAHDMADTPIKLNEALDVLHRVFGAPKPTTAPKSLAWMGDLSKLADEIAAEADEEDPKESRVTSRILELFDGAGMGATLAGRKGTRWGLFNAVTEHVDHEMGRTDDTRMDSAWFGRGNSFKQSALVALTEDLM